MMYDDVNDMWGQVQVGAVTHMLSKEWGAVSIVKPDLYAESGIDINRQTLQGMAKVMKYVEFYGTTAFLFGAHFGGRFAGGALKMLSNTGPFKKITQRLAQAKFLNLFKDKGAFAKSLGRLDKKSANEFLSNMHASIAKISKEQGKKLRSWTTIKQMRKELEKVIKTTSAPGTKSKQIGKHIDDIFAGDKGDKFRKLFVNDGKQLTKVSSSLLATSANGTTALAISLKNLRINELTSALPFTGKSWFGDSKNPLGMVFWGNAMSRLLRIGMGYRVFKTVFGDPTKIGDAFMTTAGEYFYMRNPITVVGLVRKGEPFISNLDGMTKADTLTGVGGWWQSVWTERVRHLFEPLNELQGSLELGFDEIDSFTTLVKTGYNAVSG